MKYILLNCIILHLIMLTISQNLRKIEVCYESLGCFNIPRHHSPLQKLPEDPSTLKTMFYLFRRNINFLKPEVLNYNNLTNTKYDVKQPLKIIIHGYMTRYNETGALRGVQAYLNNSPLNVILVDWELGARGPSYSSAAANTELVGRQLGLLLLELLVLGASPKQIHIIGFSLGAHVAACASEVLKQHGFLIGRITGLDPASPLFKLNHFRDRRKKLDVSDAELVDVIHTDGSRVFTDGFGLLQPLGHVDFFPNGGKHQPGCTDIKNSVLRTHFDKTLDRQIACSHIRAYHYFLETILNDSSCTFKAYPCPWGPEDFATGRCFNNNKINGQLGENVQGKGVLYLNTRDKPPFCGLQMQLTITLALRTRRVKGIIYANMKYNNMSTEFIINSDLHDLKPSNRNIFSRAVAPYEMSFQNITKISLNILFDTLNKVKQILFIDKIEMKALNGQSWKICSNITLQANLILVLELLANYC